MTQFIEIPASKKSIGLRCPLFGVGINDAEYMVRSKVGSKRTICPYYRVWANMLKRAYCKKYQERQKTYIGCSVDSKWLIFSEFRKWMKKQDWKGKQLDKDLLVVGNKIYGPDACVFVSRSLNGLLNNCGARRGKLPQGVSLRKDSGKYIAYCNVDAKLKHLGFFDTPQDAEYAYLVFKSKLICNMSELSESSNNKRLQSALLRHAKTFEDKAIKLLPLITKR